MTGRRPKSVTPCARPRLGSWLQPPWDWDPGLWCLGAKLEGMQVWGSEAHLGKTQGQGHNRGPPGNRCLEPLTREAAPWHLFRRGGPSPGAPWAPSLLSRRHYSAGRGEGALPGPAPSPEKGKTQGLASSSLAKSQLSRLLPTSFPPPRPASSLKGAVSRLVAGGKGDSAGKGWGQGLTSNP